MLRLLPLLTLGCGLDSPQAPAPASPTPPPPQQDLLGDPALYAAKGAPPSAKPWDGPWVASVYLGPSQAPGAHALATALSLPTRAWDGSLPSPARGELALIWLEAGAPAPTPAAQPGEGATVAVLGPGDPGWATRMSAALPWLGVDVVDATASTALWAEPTTALAEPAVAGLVAAQAVAAHYSLPYQPPPNAPSAIPGLAQFLAPGAAPDSDDPRAVATAALAQPEAGLVDHPEPAVRLALATSSHDQALLARLARDPEPLVRARAADRVHSVPLLSELCWDGSSVVRVVATHGLARLAQQGEHGPELQRALQEVAQRSPDAYQRWKAAFGLGWLPDQSKTLASLLEDPDVDVRRQAASSLGQQRDTTAVQALIGALDDPNSFMRSTTVRALANTNDPRTLDALRGALRDEALLVRGEAAFALRRHGIEAHAERYRPPQPPARREALVALHARPDPTTRKDATKFAAGRDDAPALLEATLQDPDPEVRKGAVQALGAAHDIAPLLLPLLSDPDPDVLVTTLESLRRAGGYPVDPLLPLLAHPDAEPRLRAVEALAALGPHPALEHLAEDPDERIRAAWAQAYPHLVRDDDPSALVRRAAAQAAAELWRGDPSLLVRAACEPPLDPHAAYWARGVLAREDDLLHLRFSFNDERRIPASHQAMRPPVVREYGHPNRG
jgi:HEAT repeat protein